MNIAHVVLRADHLQPNRIDYLSIDTVYGLTELASHLIIIEHNNLLLPILSNVLLFPVKISYIPY